MGEATVKRKLMSLLPDSSALPSDSHFSNPLEWYETIAFMKCEQVTKETCLGLRQRTAKISECFLSLYWQFLDKGA